jgi:hypothetical protein
VSGCQIRDIIAPLFAQRIAKIAKQDEYEEQKEQKNGEREDSIVPGREGRSVGVIARLLIDQFNRTHVHHLLRVSSRQPTVTTERVLFTERIVDFDFDDLPVVEERVRVLLADHDGFERAEDSITDFEREYVDAARFQLTPLGRDSVDLRVANLADQFEIDGRVRARPHVMARVEHYFVVVRIVRENISLAFLSARERH